LITIPEYATEEQIKDVEALLQITGNPPTLEQMWACMDFVWDSLGCNNQDLDWERIGKFYDHPVWLLNGLFIEQHNLSMENRDAFASEIKKLSSARVADFGGGYGSLARMIAKLCPETEVHVIEPHPSSVGLELAKGIKNFSYISQLEGEYDVIIATDVFEHVTDPLAEVEKVSANLKLGGIGLFANCFFPVIKCHLPSVFHFRYSFHTILEKMGLSYVGPVKYGHFYKKTRDVKVTGYCRLLEFLSTKAFRFLRTANVRPR